ncbi:MAG: YncE family protein [Treponemataceae bacterium]
MSGKRLFFSWCIFATLIASSFSSCEMPSAVTSARSVPALPRAVYIVNSLAETVSVLDPATKTLYSDVILTGKYPNAVVPWDGNLYVVNSGDNNVQVYREADYSLLKTIALGSNRNPWTIIIDSDRNKGYVPNFMKGTVSVIDLGTYAVIKEITVGAGPEGGCYLNGRVYVGNTAYSSGTGKFAEGKISVIDTTTDAVVATVSVEAAGWTSAENGANPQSLIALPSLNQVHVVCTGVNGGTGSDDGEVVVLDVSSAAPVVSGRLPIGGSPVVSADGANTASGLVYLAGVGGITTYAASPLVVDHPSSAYLFDATSSGFLSGAAYDSVNGVLVVTDYNNDNILIIDPGSGAVLKTIRGSDGPQTPVIFS